MMKQITLILLVLLLSCKKDNVILTHEQLLCTSKGWLTTALSISPGISIPGGPVVTDLYAYFPSCQKDDVLYFMSNGTYRSETGAIKCNITDPTIEDQGTWKFNSDKSVLTIDSNVDSPFDIDILEFSKTTFKGTQTQTDSITHTFTYTLTAIQ